MWKKFLGAEKRKIDKDTKATIWEELQLQEKHNIDFSAIWKLSSNDLCEALKKYENYSLQLRKDYKSLSDERDLYKKKFSSAVEERNKLADEREEIEQNEQNLRELYHSECNKSAGLQKQIAILEGQIVSFKNKLHDFSMHQGLDEKDGGGGGVGASDKDNLVSSDQPEQLSTSLLQELQGQNNNLDNNSGLSSKNTHNMKHKHGNSTVTRILLNPDSQLMLFVTEKELQNLRDIFDNTVTALSLKYPGLSRSCQISNDIINHNSNSKNAIVNLLDQETNKHKDSDDINNDKVISSFNDDHTSPMLKVYVGNLGSETDESQISEFFNSIAQVEAVNLPLNNLGEVNSQKDIKIWSQTSY